MEFDNIDVSELERQRYNSIKRSGEYLELNVLIGTEDETYDGHIGKMPVVTTHLNHCGPQEIACLHLTLCSIIKELEEDYPLECMLSKTGMSVTHMGVVKAPIKEDEDKEE